MPLGTLFGHVRLAAFDGAVHTLAAHRLVEIDLVGVELRAVDARDARPAADCHAAGAAHARAVHHYRVVGALRVRNARRQSRRALLHHEHAADGDDGDELLPAAVEVVLETGQASVSMLQRRLKLGYSRAARLVDQMEERGYVGPFEGSKPRQLLITREKWQELQMAKGAAPAETPPAAARYGSIHDVFESPDALD